MLKEKRKKPATCIDDKIRLWKYVKYTQRVSSSKNVSQSSTGEGLDEGEDGSSPPPSPDQPIETGDQTREAKSQSGPVCSGQKCCTDHRVVTPDEDAAMDESSLCPAGCVGEQAEEVEPPTYCGGTTTSNAEVIPSDQPGAQVKVAADAGLSADEDGAVVEQKSVQSGGSSPTYSHAPKSTHRSSKRKRKSRPPPIIFDSVSAAMEHPLFFQIYLILIFAFGGLYMKRGTLRNPLSRAPRIWVYA
jgi:hypothetical protein